MTPADRAIQRPARARLLVVDADGNLMHAPRPGWLDFLRGGDVVVANDAATLPASLHGMLGKTAQPIEVRLAAWRDMPAEGPVEIDAVVFGEGDWRARTEDRASPPLLAPGDVLRLGPLVATVREVLRHPRLVRLAFDAPADGFWRGIAAHGRLVQYAYLREPLAMWDAWTSIAAAPWAFEAPSAGFALDWRSLAAMRSRGIVFATLTHAAGLSSTGDATLDARLPLDERYRIPMATAQAIAKRDGRVIAIGTTVVRALEHAARADGSVRSGDGIATQRIGPRTKLRIVDALLTGTHEPGSSHHELLRAFATDAALARAAEALDRHGYRSHEFGDSMLVMRREDETARAAPRDTSVALDEACLTAQRRGARAGQARRERARGVAAVCALRHGDRVDRR